MVPATAARIIVGSSHGIDFKEVAAMAGVDRMTIEEVVRKVLLEDHADVVRERVAHLLMEAKV